jgi:hypothetical protein
LNRRIGLEDVLSVVDVIVSLGVRKDSQVYELHAEIQIVLNPGYYQSTEKETEMTKIAISTMSFVDKPKDLNWAELNDSWVNRDLDVMDICDMIYKGHPFCPWMNGRRHNDNFICAQFIGVDLDDGTYECSMDYLVEHPLVRLYGAIIYRTPSSKTHAPKSRVLFLLDEAIQRVDGYRLAIETVYNMFKGADPACVDPVRFFFGNGKLRESKDTAGIWFSEKINFPVSDLRAMYKQNVARAAQEEREKTRRAEPPREPFKKNTIEQVFERLDKVDAYSLDYREWQKVCSGLKSEFGDAAFEPTKMWSDKPGKDPLTRKYWDSLGRSGAPVTIATVMQTLKEHGA